MILFLSLKFFFFKYKHDIKSRHWSAYCGVSILKLLQNMRYYNHFHNTNATNKNVWIILLLLNKDSKSDINNGKLMQVLNEWYLNFGDTIFTKSLKLGRYLTERIYNRNRVTRSKIYNFFFQKSTIIKTVKNVHLPSIERFTKKH